MAEDMLNFAYTIGTIDVAQDISPGVAQTGFRDYSTMSSGDVTRVVAVQGAKRAYMVVSKVGAILRPSTYIDGTNGEGATVNFDAGTITVFTDLGWQHIVYNDTTGAAQNAEGVLRTFSPDTLADLKTTPIPAAGKSVAILRNILADDKKSAIYEWDPDETAAGDDFYYVVSTLSATGRWVRLNSILEVAALANDAAAYDGSLYAVNDDLRHKNSTSVVKKVPLVENYHQGEYITFAEWQAVSTTPIMPWSDGDTFVFRGITEENDLGGEKPTFIWDASSTNTDALGVTHLSPDDISGSNPGRAILTEPSAMSKFTNADATPSLAGGRFHRCADTVPAAITALDDMVDLQPHWIFPGAQDQVFTNGASLKCPGGRQFTLRTDGAPIMVASDNSVVSIFGAQDTAPVASIAALTALNTAALQDGETRFVNDDLRGGLFVWDSNDRSTEVGYETSGNEGVYYAPDSDATGASGAWVRAPYRQGQDLNIDWFGALPNSASDSKAAIQAAIDFAEASDNRGVFVPPNKYTLATGIQVSENVCLYGTSIWLNDRPPFADAAWLLDSHRKGSTLYFSQTSGDALIYGRDQAGGGGSFEHGGSLENLILIGPGSGTGVGFHKRNLIGAHISHVFVCNFPVGIWNDWAEEVRSYSIGVMGCETAFLFDGDGASQTTTDAIGSNENSYYGTQINACGQAIDVQNGKLNSFYGLLIQHCTDGGVQIRNTSPAGTTVSGFKFADVWLENGSDAAQTLAGYMIDIDGNEIQSCVFENWQIQLSGAQTGNLGFRFITGTDCGNHKFEGFTYGSGVKNYDFDLPSGWRRCHLSRFESTSASGSFFVRDETQISVTFDVSDEPTLTVTQGLSDLASVDVHAERNGRNTTLRIPEFTGTGDGTIIILTALDESFRPRSTTGFFTLRLDEGGTFQVGVARIKTNGTIEIFSDIAGNSFTLSTSYTVSGFDLTYTNEPL